MPTVLDTNGYQFFIHSFETGPARVQVRHGNGTCFIELETLEVSGVNLISNHAIQTARDIVARNQMYLMERWNEVP